MRPSEKANVVERAGCDGANVEVAEDDPEEADPRERHVVHVQLRDRVPELVTEHAERLFRVAVHAAADEVAERVTRERVEREERVVREDGERAAAEPELPV